MAEALFIGGSHDGEWIGVDNRGQYAFEARVLYKAKAHIDSPQATYSNEVRELYERSTIVGNVVVYRLSTMRFSEMMERLVKAYVPPVNESR